MEVKLWGLLGAAAALSIERLCYVWIWHAPASFRAIGARLPILATRKPVQALQVLFYAFKILQAAVFVAWCELDGSIWPPRAGTLPVALGIALIAGGQFLNASVFYRLGAVGVFYGNRFGHEAPLYRGFPFSFLEHPQYAGTLLTIWGLFLVFRFPHPDWYWLPVIETTYYAAAAHFER